MNDILKRTATLANDLMDSFTWAIKKLDSPGRNISREQAVGKTVEVSVAIEPGKVGQVLLILGGTIQQYSARAKRNEDSFAKGTRVLVKDIGNHMVYVESLDEVDADNGQVMSF